MAGENTVVTGINENVEVLGRMFHVQTELTPGENPRIRTVVFFEGKLIASQARPVESEVKDDQEIRELIKAQQAQIIDNFGTRAAALAADQENAEADVRSTTVLKPAPLAGRATDPPDPESDAKLVESLAVRRLFSLFQSSLPTDSEPGADELELYLKKALREIRKVTEDPAFVDVRLDEQVAFYDLKTRALAQLKGSLELDTARSVWTELVRLAAYLVRINHRRELVAFDRRLFTWALARIGGRGMSEDVLIHLRHARGRSAELDQLLDHPDDVSADQWMDIIMRLIDSTIGEEL